MKAGELIKKNQELQQQLNTKNEQYYGELVVYLRTKGLLKNDKMIEEKALEILQDILEAQKDGIDAEIYFGKTPKVYADELLTSVPISLFDFIKMVSLALGIYLLFSLFPALVTPTIPFDLGTFGLVALYSIIGALLVVWLIGVSVYVKQKKLAQVIYGLAFGGLFLGGMFLSMVIKTSYQFKLEGSWSLIFLIVLLIVMGIFFLKQDTDEQKMWAPFLPVITSCAILGLFTRINRFADFFETTVGNFTIAGIMVASLLIQYLLIYLYMKKANTLSK